MRFRKHYMMAGGYVLLTILLTYPVLLRLTHHLAGFEGQDNLQWRWFLWWFKHAVLTLQSSVTDLSILFAPTGGQQPLYLITTFVPAVALPLTLLGGPTLSFNLSFLASFALSAYTAYLLAYYLTHHQSAAFVAGLIFGFYPARFGYATGTFLGQLTTYFLPLYVLALLMVARRPTRRRTGWLIVLLASLCLTWPLHVAYGVVIFTASFLIFQLFNWARRPAMRVSIKYFVLTFSVTLAVVIWFYLPLIRTVSQGRGNFGVDTSANDFSVDLLAFVSPSNYHPLWQPLGLLPDYATRVLADDNDIQERLAYVGLVPLLLVAVGLVRFGRHLRLWLVTALIAVTLSLGPLLKFNGGPPIRVEVEGLSSYVVLPYALFSALPILRWSGVLGRLNVVTMLCVGVMAAYGVKYLSSRFKRWRTPLVAALSTIILIEFLTIFPFPTEPDTVPVYYEQLKQSALSEPQMIIDFPLVGDPAYNNYAMHYQTLHRQPIAGGHFMRKPAGTREMTGFINQLLSPPMPQDIVTQPDLEARLGLLNEFGFTKIVVRPDLLVEDEIAQAQLAFLTEWLGEADTAGSVAVFEIPPGETSPGAITTLLAGDGWQIPDQGAQLWLQAPADLLVYVDGEPEPALSLELSIAAPDPDRYLSLDVDGRSAGRLYLIDETLHYNLPLNLKPGFHQLTFRPEESCQQRCAPVIFSHLALTEKTLPQTEPVIFEGRLALADFDISAMAARPGQPLVIYLYWQEQARTEHDYSAFLHLVAPSGEIMGQADYLLGGWNYPTSHWPEGHVAAAPSLVFVPTGAAPGGYQIRAGVYHAETGERLRVSSGLRATSGANEQESVILSTIRIEP